MSRARVDVDTCDRAARGEVIRVTDRGQPKAILAPVPGPGRLIRGIEEGWVRPAGSRRMSLYVGSRALLKRYVAEADSDSNDVRRTHVVELDEATCDLAAQLAFDVRQAAAARALSITFLGV